MGQRWAGLHIILVKLAPTMGHHASNEVCNLLGKSKAVFVSCLSTLSTAQYVLVVALMFVSGGPEISYAAKRAWGLQGGLVEE